MKRSSGWNGFAPFTAVTVFSLCLTVNAAPATGPLKVHSNNPRYFTDGTKGPDGSSRAVYLTGSHHWNNLQDSGEIGGKLRAFDYAGYLQFMRSNHHNFMRMWAWEGNAK